MPSSAQSSPHPTLIAVRSASNRSGMFTFQLHVRTCSDKPANMLHEAIARSTHENGGSQMITSRRTASRRGEPNRPRHESAKPESKPRGHRGGNRRSGGSGRDGNPFEIGARGPSRKAAGASSAAPADAETMLSFYFRLPTPDRLGMSLASFFLRKALEEGCRPKRARPTSGRAAISPLMQELRCAKAMLNRARQLLAQAASEALSKE